MKLNINLEKKTDREDPAKEPQQTNFQWQGDDQNTFGRLNLRPGLDLIASRAKVHRGLKVEFACGDAPLELAFHICGVRKYRIECSHADRRECIAGPGQFAVTHLPFCHGEIQSLGEEDHFSIAIYVTADFLRTAYSEARWAELPEPTHSLLQGNSDGKRPMVKLASTRTEMAVAVQKIMNCPYQGALGHMYLEGQVLELMAMTLADAAPEPGLNGNLGRKERDGIEAAHFHLLKDLGNPPTLDALARIAGMNRNKLNRGFRLLYGDSVFGVFRRAKLDQALLLLDQGDLNVGEVAYAAGFKSHSHLTRAFVNQFGISPKSYRKCPFNGRDSIRPRASHLIDSMRLPDDPWASNLLKLIRNRQL